MRIFQVSPQRSRRRSYAPDATIPLNLLLSISGIIPALRRLYRAAGGHLWLFCSTACTGRPSPRLSGVTMSPSCRHKSQPVVRRHARRSPASAHFPKFVIHRITHFHELRKVMGTSKHIDSSAAFLFEVPGSNSPLVVQELQIGH